MKTNREKLLLFTAIFLGATLLLHTFIIKPQIKELRNLRAKAMLTAVQLSQMQAKLNRKKKVETAYEDIKERISTQKISERVISEMLQQIQRSASAANVETEKTLFIKDESLEYFNRYTILFEGKGSAEDLMRLLYELQDPEHLMKITEMEFKMREYELHMILRITRVIYADRQSG